MMRSDLRRPARSISASCDERCWVKLWWSMVVSPSREGDDVERRDAKTPRRREEGRGWGFYFWALLREEIDHRDHGGHRGHREERRREICFVSPSWSSLCLCGL